MHSPTERNALHSETRLPARRRWKRAGLSVVTAIGSCLGLACAAQDRPDAGAPHLLLVSIDTLGANALESVSRDPGDGGFGALRGRFHLCERAVSTAAWTLPAHASLLTGLYPKEHRANRTAARLEPGVSTVAERLRIAGYDTVAFTDGGYVDGRYGLARGFDLYDDRAESAYRILRWLLPRRGAPEADPGRAPYDRATRFLDLRRTGRPLFLFLHTYAVHDYYQGHVWAEADTERRRLADRLSSCSFKADLCSAADWAVLESWYQAEIARIGGLLHGFLEHATVRLRGRPVAVVIVSDHGEGFDVASGRMHHGGWLYPEILAIPLWLLVPDGAHEARCPPVASLVDVAPTLLEIAGLDASDLPGRSLVATSDATQAPRLLYAEEHELFWQHGTRRSWHPSSGLPTVAVIDPELWALAGSEDELVFSWGEAAGGALPSHERVEQLAHAARAYREAASSSESSLHPVAADLRERLRALGYLETP